MNLLELNDEELKSFLEDGEFMNKNDLIDSILNKINEKVDWWELDDIAIEDNLRSMSKKELIEYSKCM